MLKNCAEAGELQPETHDTQQLALDATSAVVETCMKVLQLMFAPVWTPVSVQNMAANSTVAGASGAAYCGGLIWAWCRTGSWKACWWRPNTGKLTESIEEKLYSLPVIQEGDIICQVQVSPCMTYSPCKLVGKDKIQVKSVTGACH